MAEKKKKDKDREKTIKSKPYETTYSEIFVEPVGAGPKKEK